MGRFHPREPSELDPVDRELLRMSMVRADLDGAYEHLLSTQDRNVHRTLAHDPAILEAFRTWMSRLWAKSGLSARRRELVILTAARAADSRYEWHQHVRHGLVAGLSEDEIRAISDGDRSPFSDSDAVSGTSSRLSASPCWRPVTSASRGPSRPSGCAPRNRSSAGVSRDCNRNRGRRSRRGR